MQVWYLTDMKVFETHKKVSYLNALKMKKRSSIIQLADAIADRSNSLDTNKPKSEESSGANEKIVKHSMLQAIHLCKDIWKIIRGRESLIKSKINELQVKREKYSDD